MRSGAEAAGENGGHRGNPHQPDDVGGVDGLLISTQKMALRQIVSNTNSPTARHGAVMG